MVASAAVRSDRIGLLTAMRNAASTSAGPTSMPRFSRSHKASSAERAASALSAGPAMVSRLPREINDTPNCASMRAKWLSC